MNPQTEYQQRLQARQQTREQLRDLDDRAVNLRSALFVVGMLVAWVVLGWGVPWPWLLVPIAGFAAVVVYHESVRRKQRAAVKAIEHYERCLARLEGKWPGEGPDGSEFLDAAHPYAGDLDIFGPGSLFQLLSSPVTPVGAKTLASWLASSRGESLPAREIILERQQAVQALREQLDVREQLALIGPGRQSQHDAQELQRWLTRPGALTATWVRVVGAGLGLLGTAALVYLFVGQSPSPLILVLFAQMAYLWRLREPLQAITKHSERAVTELQRYVGVLEVLEAFPAESGRLAQLRAELQDGDERASQTIHQLERSVSQFENMRRNVAIAPLALITMAGMHFASAIDRWRSTHGVHVDRWFEALGELEALLAFSQFHFENPEYCFPTLTEAAPQFAAQGLSHPLLDGVAAVANDVSLGEDCRLLLVSGSNMSGKSTLLRSVGINTVLAWAGAPVFASELQLSPLRVAAAMRMQDSLQTGTSHFYAELKRIQLVVEMAGAHREGQPAVLFLLDEILHGTNSHDRLIGARGVIRGLLDTGAIGLVTTHDLALSEMVDELTVPARNVHFCDQWRDGQMVFDYQMRDGVVPKSNALSLMRLLGLEV